MFPQNPTRTAQTTESYLKRAANLVKNAKDELSLPKGQNLDPRQFAAWLAHKRPQLSRSSWRQYKSSAVCLFEKLATDEALEALDFLKEIDGKACKTVSDKTSSTKLKRLPQKDLLKLTDYLRKKKGKWHQCLLDWLVAASLTGLRPQEWSGSSISEIDGEPALQAPNAKNTNGRSHGPTRTLLLGALSQDELECLSSHIRRVEEWSALGQYDEFYKGCSVTLYHITRKLWPRRTQHITLYSCRHQFTANAKASGFSTVEIAAMMGHAVDTTATVHYGKKAAGQDLLRVRAADEDISKVDAKFDELMAQKRKAGQLPEPKPKARARAAAPAAPSAAPPSMDDLFTGKK